MNSHKNFNIVKVVCYEIFTKRPRTLLYVISIQKKILIILDYPYKLKGTWIENAREAQPKLKIRGRLHPK